MSSCVAPGSHGTVPTSRRGTLYVLHLDHVALVRRSRALCAATESSVVLLWGGSSPCGILMFVELEAVNAHQGLLEAVNEQATLRIRCAITAFWDDLQKLHT